MDLFQMLVVVLTAVGLTAASWSNLNCPAPRAPDNGLSFIFRNGELVHFRCHPGYYMKGKSVVYCVNNQWTGPAPECIAIRGHAQIPSSHTIQENHPHQTAHHQPTSSTDKDRRLFSWDGRNKDSRHHQTKPGVYGDGPRRLPLINGIWPPQSQQVMTLGPQSTPGPHGMMKEEVDIAELRHKQLEEVKNQRTQVDISEAQLKKKRRSKKEKRKKKKKGMLNLENVIDENAPRETVISLGTTEEGDAISIAFAKMPNDTKPQKHKYRHDGHRKHGKDKSKKWRNVDQYSTHLVSRASRVDTSGISPYSHRYIRHQNPSTYPKTSNEVAELRGRPIEQVDGGNKTSDHKGSMYPLSDFDTTCLESLYGHDVPMIAPHVVNAFVYRYETKKNKDFPFNSYLQVKYRCLSGFGFVNHHVQTLNCRQGTWVGEVPRCQAIKKQ